MLLLPYFEDRLDSSSKVAFQELRKHTLVFLQEVVSYGSDIYDACERHVGTKSDWKAHYTMLSLARHNLDYLDSVSRLLDNSCVSSCPPLVRSILEATISFLYIIEERPAERALAYQLAHIKRRIGYYRQADPADPSHAKLAAKLAHDKYMPNILSKIPDAKRKQGAVLEAELINAAWFKPILDEWDRVKGTSGKDPHWYMLFSGSKKAGSLADLAERLHATSLYLFNYKEWSHVAHACGAIDNLTTSSGQHSPLHFPEHYATAMASAVIVFTTFLREFANFYDPNLAKSMEQHTMRVLIPKMNRLKEAIQLALANIA